MKQVADQFFALPAPRRREVLLNLCAHALAVWEAGFPQGGKITYQEMVTGSVQTLDVVLPREALDATRQGIESPDIWERYTEPIVAIQDGDLTFPDALEFAYFAIYNAYRLYLRHADIEEKLILNQALSALPEEEMPEIFSAEVGNAA